MLRWQNRTTLNICSNIGYVSGTIEHSWHGSKERRAYVSRWDILLRHGFNPEEDLKRNTSGILELSGNKLAFAHDIDAYVRSRNEDANTF